MSDYNSVRLEQGGVVVAYLAPTRNTDIPHANDVLSTPRTGASHSAIARDRVLWTTDIQIDCTIQGTDDGLPSDHAAALLALFGGSVVTAEQQVLRLLHYAHEVGGSFNFYHRGRTYTATSDAGVNIVNAVFPQVVIKSIRENWKAGRSRCDLIIVLSVGVPRIS